jgi:hypothetical protein
MPFGGVREAKDADDVVAYLKSLNWPFSAAQTLNRRSGVEIPGAMV